MKTRKNNKTEKANNNTSKVENNKVKFEETTEGRAMLDTLSASWQQIRKENNFHGETGILMAFAKKNRTRYYTAPFEKDIDKMISPKAKNKTGSSDLLLPIIQKQENYKRGNLPKN